MRKYMQLAVVSLGLAGAAVGLGSPAFAQDEAYQAALHDIEQTMGFVPAFIRQVPPAFLPSAWENLKAIELSETTAIPVKYKLLISIAVAAQIPCNYCVWLDTQSARAAGATDEEIHEAVMEAGLTRYWSTFFHGSQIDFDELKREFGGDPSAMNQQRQ